VVDWDERVVVVYTIVWSRECTVACIIGFGAFFFCFRKKLEFASVSNGCCRLLLHRPFVVAVVVVVVVVVAAAVLETCHEKGWKIKAFDATDLSSVLDDDDNQVWYCFWLCSICRNESI
jgi:hypothetical protein